MKTTENDADPLAFLTGVTPDARREDAHTLLAMMKNVTGHPPRMWGDSIVGFDSYDYTRRDGSAHRFFRTGFSPRKANLSIYIMPGFKKYTSALEALGPHKHSVSCLYVTRLARVDLDVLRDLVADAYSEMNRIYPPG